MKRDRAFSLSSLRGILGIPYRGAVALRVWCYEQGWLPTRSLPVPVISIGNLTVGGTGKTPMVMWLAQWLNSQGWKVGILSRGYGRTARVPLVLVSNFQEVLSDVQEAGDEPFLMARRCPGVCVAVGGDRVRLGRWVLEQCPVEVFVLDDGFQHLGLHRDVNLLLVDVSDGTGMRHLLPGGRLREPLTAADRASAIIFTRVGRLGGEQEMVGRLDSMIGRRLPHVTTRFDADSFIHVPTGTYRDRQGLAGKRALVFSGIGNAAAFRRDVEALGVDIAEELKFPDHYAYSRSDIMDIRNRAHARAAGLMVTTEKDAVKIEHMVDSADDLWALRLRVEFLEGQDRLEELVGGIGGGVRSEK